MFDRWEARRKIRVAAELGKADLDAHDLETLKKQDSGFRVYAQHQSTDTPD